MEKDLNKPLEGCEPPGTTKEKDEGISGDRTGDVASPDQLEDEMKPRELPEKNFPADDEEPHDPGEASYPQDAYEELQKAQRAQEKKRATRIVALLVGVVLLAILAYNVLCSPQMRVKRWLTTRNYEKIDEYLSGRKRMHKNFDKEVKLYEYCLVEAIKINEQRYKAKGFQHVNAIEITNDTVITALCEIGKRDRAFMAEILLNCIIRDEVVQSTAKSAKQQIIKQTLETYPDSEADSLIVIALRANESSYGDYGITGDVVKSIESVEFLTKPQYHRINEVIMLASEYRQADKEVADFQKQIEEREEGIAACRKMVRNFDQLFYINAVVLRWLPELARYLIVVEDGYFSEEALLEGQITDDLRPALGLGYQRLYVFRGDPKQEQVLLAGGGSKYLPVYRTHDSVSGAFMTGWKPKGLWEKAVIDGNNDLVSYRNEIAQLAVRKAEIGEKITAALVQ